MVQAQVSIVIPTVESRIPLADELAIRTGADIIVDPVGDGKEKTAADNHVRAMLQADPDADWVVILEDDAVPVGGFVDRLVDSLSELTDPRIVSLYLGRQRPPSIQPVLERNIANIDSSVSWLQMVMLYWGVGVCIPRQYVDSVADHVLSSSGPWDTTVGLWAHNNRVPVLYTWPSMVDHLDEETSIRHADQKGRPKGRVAWKTGHPRRNGEIAVVK